MKQTTVVHVTEALGGGVRSALVNYTSALPEYKHIVVARERSGQSTYEWPDNVKIKLVNSGLLGFLKAALIAINEEMPDVVHLHSSHAGVLRLILKRGCAIVYSPHCFATEREDISSPVRLGISLIEKMLSARLQVLAAVSPNEAILAYRLNNKANVVLVPNPPPIQVSSVTRKFKVARVVMVGRVCPQKGPDIFADAARLAKQKGYPEKFLWIGDGDSRAVNELRASGVNVTGWLDPADALQLLADSELYVHTARWEGAPISTIEAAGLGVPVISRRISSMVSLRYETFGTTADQLVASVRRYFDEETFRESVKMKTQDVVRVNSASAMTYALKDAYQRATRRSASKTNAKSPRSIGSGSL
ncbi:glycosyltransferase [Rhodococcus sp. NPDC077669]|uniref:glycosyltransferase n=1 Tax=Rhodococcus sp. NPDC077669 TaxID=3155174 RepID=UPI00342A4552